MGTENRTTEKAAWEPGGPSPNPGGQPKWAKATRDALRDCAPLAAKHLARILGAPPPVDEAPTEAALYAKASAKDRNAAAELVLRYTLTLPKATVKHEGKGGEPLSISINLESEKT